MRRPLPRDMLTSHLTAVCVQTIKHLRARTDTWAVYLVRGMWAPHVRYTGTTKSTIQTKNILNLLFEASNNCKLYNTKKLKQT